MGANEAVQCPRQRPRPFRPGPNTRTHIHTTSHPPSAPPPPPAGLEATVSISSCIRTIPRLESKPSQATHVQHLLSRMLSNHPVEAFPEA